MSEKKPKKEKKTKKPRSVGKIIRNSILAVIGLAVLLVIGLNVFNVIQQEDLTRRVEEAMTEEVTQDEIDTLVTREEEGGAEIDALPDGDPSDTWAIYAYIDGSNLENGGADSLSELTKYIVDLESTELEEESDDKLDGLIEEFLSEVWEQGSDLPERLYTVQATGTGPKESDDSDAGEDTSAVNHGFGSGTIEKLTAADLPENVTVVMMTGGTAYWENPSVNANRSQIFVYDTEGFREVENDHVKDMGSSSTMAGFLAYCEENYPADHRILSIMDHGSGIGGFASDDLFQDSISYAEFKEALESVYTADPDDPPFDLIDFDACLMGSVEMAENLYGFTSYMVATEEVGLGGSHDYEAYLEALSENTGIHPAKLGKLIVDGTIDYIAGQDYRLSEFDETFFGATMSLTDVTKAHEVYQAYEALCAAVLKDAVKDSSALTTMSRAAAQNLRFGVYHYNVFNAVDLGILASNLLDAYPEEAGAVLDALSEASLYRAATRYSKNATGLSVYFPTEISDMNGLNYFLYYINEVCESEDIAALYYYTFAGCLNEEYTDYVEAKGYGTPETLDTSPLRQLTENEITAGDGANFSLTLTQEQQDLIQDLSLYLVGQDEDGTWNFGEDKRLSVDENGTVTSDFDGTWISIDGEMLEADVIDVTEDRVRYKAEILDNDEDAYLVLVQNRGTGAFSIQGVYTYTQETYDGAVVANYPSELDYDTEIAPVITIVNLDENSLQYGVKESVNYTEDTSIGLSAMEDGEYYLMIKAYDVRGDEYYSAPMHFVVKDQEITEASVSQDSYAVSRE